MREMGREERICKEKVGEMRSFRVRTSKWKKEKEGKRVRNRVRMECDRKGDEVNKRMRQRRERREKKRGGKGEENSEVRSGSGGKRTGREGVKRKEKGVGKEERERKIEVRSGSEKKRTGRENMKWRKQAHEEQIRGEKRRGRQDEREGRKRKK